jgi:hypothetical protein
MILERVIWTALPRGLDDHGRPLVSLHVAPRLTTDDGDTSLHKLGEFPAFVDWPKRLEQITFKALFDSGESAAAKPVMTPSGSLWAALFESATPVGPHAFQDHAKRDLHIFPVRPILQFLETTYGALSAAGPQLPSIDDPSGPLAAFGPLERVIAQSDETLKQSWSRELSRAHEKAEAAAAAANGIVVPPLADGMVVADQVADPSLPGDQQAAQNALFGAYRFYRRPGSDRPDFPADYVEPKPEVPKPEFHEIVAMLADHPELLRRLGLVIDLVVDLEEAAANLPAQGVIRIIPDGDLPEQPPRCPGTRYDLDRDWFGARPQDDFAMQRGMLRLHPEFWDLFQVDVDGAALQAVGFADTLHRLRNPDRRSQATPDQTGAPALHSAGFALARQGRAEQLLEGLKDRRGKNDDLESGTPVELDAEHLVRGYRVDVFDEKGPDGSRWFSLHQRISHHDVDGLDEPLPPITDEGYLKATAASGERKDHPIASDDLYLHETVAAWEGWSLAAARPGKRIVEPGEGEAPDHPIARFDPAAGKVLPIVTTVEVAPGTLPRLRVGRTYRMRIRTVDLAGNSRDFVEHDIEVPGPDTASETQRYLRFEPLPSPAVLRRHLDTEGESLEHLVIRSDEGVTPAAYATLPAVVEALQHAGAAHSYAEDSQRHLAPPKGSELMAEQDGRFEVAFGGTASQATAALRVALREAGTFLDPTIVDTATGQKTVAQSTISTFPAGTPLPAHGQPLPNGAYAFHPDADVVLPYLADPLAVGVALTGFDHTGSEVFHVEAPFSGTWPGMQPLRLRLSESGGAIVAAFVDGVIEIGLPKAEVIRAQLSSVLADGRLNDLAIWAWTPAASRTRSLRDAAVHGRHWMLTPYRWITLTHAVQHPLAVPDMTGVTHYRMLGDTDATFQRWIACHAKSTGRLDVYASWTEDVDLLTEDVPRMRSLGTEIHHEARAFGWDIGPGEDNAALTATGRQSRHAFGDTKYRRILYHSVATTRFREYLPREIADDPLAIQRVEATHDGAGDDATEKMALVHHVPSTARPAAPDVVYTVPTFRWERQDDGPKRTHVRHGSAVRVWLRRPWFSSGDGEQLGVVLEPGTRLPGNWRQATSGVLARNVVTKASRKAAGPSSRFGVVGADGEAPIRARDHDPSAFEVDASASAAGPELAVAMGPVGAIGPASALATMYSKADLHRMLHPYVTKWGDDPVWASRHTEQPATPGAFPRRVSTAGPLSIGELPSAARVMVAGHEVHYDTERRLWFCDLELDLGHAYFPFVRLALARYQPMSLDGAHLSRVIQTDFIQVVPDRTAVIERTQGGLSVHVSGHAGRNWLGPVTPLPHFFYDIGGVDPEAPNTTIRAALERRIAGIPGDLGWERLDTEVTLTATANNFKVDWTGSLTVPGDAFDHGSHRVLITEIETFPRDLVPGDATKSTSPLDFVRERIVYADTFEL